MTLEGSHGTEKALTILKPKRKDLRSIRTAAVSSTVQSTEAKCTCYKQPAARVRSPHNRAGK